MNDELIKRLNAIYKEFGFEKQSDKLSEECIEYFESWNDFDSDHSDKLSEIADVFIISAQLVLNNPTIMQIVNDKIERTEKRIKEGYYNGSKI